MDYSTLAMSKKISLLNDRLENYFSRRGEDLKMNEWYRRQLVLLEKCISKEAPVLEINLSDLRKQEAALDQDIKNMQNDLDLATNSYDNLYSERYGQLKFLGEAIYQKLEEETAYEVATIKSSNQCLDATLTELNHLNVECNRKYLDQATIKTSLEQQLGAQKAECGREPNTLDMEKIKWEQSSEQKEEKWNEFNRREKEIRLQWNQKRDAMLERVKEKYDKEMASMNNQISEVEKDIIFEQNKTIQLEEKKGARSLNITQLERIKLEKYQFVSQSKKSHSEQITELKTVVDSNTKFSARLSQMNKDVSREIEAYALLVNEVENFSPSPKKARKRTSIAKESIRISEWKEDHMIIKNVGNNVAPLFGCQLRSESTNSVFSFQTVISSQMRP